MYRVCERHMPIKRPHRAVVPVMCPKPNPWGCKTVSLVVGAPSNHPLVARALRRAAPVYTSTVPANDREPDLRPALGEWKALQVGADIRAPCSDLFNRPSIIKSGPNLPLRDPPGALGPGLLV